MRRKKIEKLQMKAMRGQVIPCWIRLLILMVKPAGSKLDTNDMDTSLLGICSRDRIGSGVFI